MKTATKRTNKNLRPKHKHTKDYLKHYYPFIPLFVSIGFLLLVVFAPAFSKNAVLSAVTNLAPSELLISTNSERQKAGVTPLKINSELNIAAKAKADDMVLKDYWSHNTPEGQDPWIFIDKVGYKYQKAGENLAYGFNNSDDTITGWMNSKTHRENLLDSSYTEVGFGVASSLNFVTKGPETIVVAFYAQPSQEAMLAPSANTSSDGNLLGQSKSISNANLFTGSSWGVYAVGAILGMCTMYIASVHGSKLRKAIKKGERYIIKHPLIDSFVIILTAFGILLLRSSGFIL